MWDAQCLHFYQNQLQLANSWQMVLSLETDAIIGSLSFCEDSTRKQLLGAVVCCDAQNHPETHHTHEALTGLTDLTPETPTLRMLVTSAELAIGSSAMS